MGKHSASRGAKPQKIERLAPASSSGETPREASRRKRQLANTPAVAARRKRRRRRVVLACLVVLVVLVAAGAIAAYAYVKRVNEQIVERSSKTDPQVKKVLEQKPRQPGEPFYMVIMGSDHRQDEVRARSDTLILARVDPQKKHVTLLSIPRDLRVQIEGHGRQKINAAANFGGPSLTIQTVKDLTGLPITHYMEVDFNGFQDIVTAMGGVWVDVPHRIHDVKAAPMREYATVQKGYQKLDGPHALTFARSRSLLGDDWTRIKDQQILIKAMFKQTMTIGNVFNVTRIVDAVVQNVSTDMNVGQMVNLATDLHGMDPSQLEMATMPGTAKYIGGVSYVVPDTAGIDTMISRLEHGVPVVATTGSAEATGSVALKPAEVTLAVRNGAGISGLAAEGASKLQKDGFQVIEVGNAGQPVYRQTIIVYKADDAKAKLVHDTLGFGRVVQSRGMYSFKTDILVVVGKDWRTGIANAPDTSGN